MKKFTRTLFSSMCLSSMAYAQPQYPWQALMDDHIPSSMIGVPIGDFSNRKIAVVDDGFYTSHPGFQGKLESGYNGTDSSTNIDASIVDCPGDPDNGKTASHGTHVAGIIAQMNPHLGIVPYKDCDSNQKGNVCSYNCLNALIGRSDIEAVNLSFGFIWEKMISPIKKLAQEGKTIVIAAGNENTVIEDEYLPSQKKMLSEILEELKGRVVFVGATEKQSGIQQRASFSNKPSPALSQFFIAAPGTEILSYVPFDTDPSRIGEKSGTSMAAPIFVGALMRLATTFNIDVDEAREILFKTAIKANRGYARIEGTGQGIMDFNVAWAFLMAYARGKGTDQWITDFMAARAFLMNVEEWRATLESLSKEQSPDEKKVDRVLKHLQDAQQVTTNDYRNAARAHYMNANSERAIELYEQLSLEEMEFRDYTRLAYSHYLLEDYKAAANAYDRAFPQVENILKYRNMYNRSADLYEDFSDAARAYYGSGRYTVAAQIWDELLKEFPQRLGDDFEIDDIVDAHEKAGNIIYASELKARAEELNNRAEELREAEEELMRKKKKRKLTGE